MRMKCRSCPYFTDIGKVMHCGALKHDLENGQAMKAHSTICNSPFARKEIATIMLIAFTMIVAGILGG